MPANSALRLMVDHHEGLKLDPSWTRWPGRPRRTWLHHIQQDLRVTPSTAWASEVARGQWAWSNAMDTENDDDGFYWLYVLLSCNQ